MGIFSVREERDFHNLTVEPRRMHLLDEPCGFVSALAKDNLAHQMRFSAKALEDGRRCTHRSGAGFDGQIRTHLYGYRRRGCGLRGDAALAG